MFTLIIEDKYGRIADEYTFDEGDFVIGRRTDDGNGISPTIISHVEDRHDLVNLRSVVECECLGRGSIGRGVAVDPPIVFLGKTGWRYIVSTQTHGCVHLSQPDDALLIQGGKWGPRTGGAWQTREAWQNATFLDISMTCSWGLQVRKHTCS